MGGAANLGNPYSPAQYYSNYILQSDATGTYYQQQVSSKYSSTYRGSGGGGGEYYKGDYKSKAKSKSKSKGKTVTKYITNYHRIKNYADYRNGKSKKSKGHYRGSKAESRVTCKSRKSKELQYLKYQGSKKKQMKIPYRKQQPGYGFAYQKPRPRVINYVYSDGRFQRAPNWSSSDSSDSRDYLGATWDQSKKMLSQDNNSLKRYYYYGDKGKGGYKGSKKAKSKAKGAKAKGVNVYDYNDYDYDYDKYDYGVDDYFFYDDCAETAAPTFTPFPSFTPMPSAFVPTHPASVTTTSAPAIPVITERPTIAETNRPTVPPETPTQAPSMMPTLSPTMTPTKVPTQSPTMIPTKNPTASPTKSPTMSPTAPPTKSPTVSPTISPTKAPTMMPAQSPTQAPTASPTMSPTVIPTGTPTMMPTATPTTGVPTISPTTGMPTGTPTGVPTPAATTGAPTGIPTRMPTAGPTTMPTTAPSTNTMAPTGVLEVIVPFQLEYMIDPSNTPSDADLANIEALTMRFLEEIFLLMYDFDPNTTMETFGLAQLTHVNNNGVVTVDYEASVLFGMDSSAVPTMADVEAQIMTAFQGLNLEVYLDLLQNTNADNAFMSTTDVRYISAARKRSGSVSAAERYRLSAKELIGVVGAGVIVMLGVAVMYYDRQRRRADRLRKVALTI